MSLSKKRLVRKSCTSSPDLGPPMFIMRMPVLAFCSCGPLEVDKWRVLLLLLLLLETAAEAKPSREDGTA